MADNKYKFALWLQPETMTKVEKLYKDDDCRSRSEFIEKAILFYCGYLAAKDYRDYIPNVFISTMKGTLDSLEDRIANLLFKNAVELSMLSHLTAATHKVSEDTVADLREMCVADVKKIHGAIRLEDAIKFQKD